MAAVAVGLLLLTPLIATGSKKIKKIKPTANPPQYVGFSKLLSQDAQFHHAVDRLTFGPRSGDLERIQQIGLQRWLDFQLHPEKVAENPMVEQRLAPLESLRLSIHDTYVHYPPPQLIAAVARGRGQLPDDPELRALVVRLADRYLQRREAASQAATSTTAGQLPGAPPGVLNLNTSTEMEKAAAEQKLNLRRMPTINPISIRK